MHLYFAYGSNLDPQRIQRRCPDSTYLGPATAKNHLLTFPRTYDDPQYGGVASIQHPDTNPITLSNHPANTHGFIYQLSDNDLDRLDKYEGVAFNGYVREQIDVHPLSDSSPNSNKSSIITAWTYFAVPRPAHPVQHHTPSRQYLNTIITGAIAHKLPSDYIAWLKTIPTLKKDPPPYYGREII